MSLRYFFKTNELIEEFAVHAIWKENMMAFAMWPLLILVLILVVVG